jgi:hypothetical protein
MQENDTGEPDQNQSIDCPKGGLLSHPFFNQAQQQPQAANQSSAPQQA